MDNGELVIQHIDRMEKSVTSTLSRVEVKVDSLDSKLDDVNERAIKNSADIDNIKKDIVGKSSEFHRQLNIVHKVVRDCKLDHITCPEKINKTLEDHKKDNALVEEKISHIIELKKKEAVVEAEKNIKLWFLGTWVMTALGIGFAVMKEYILK